MQRREYLFVYDAFLAEPGWGRSVASLEASLAAADLRGRTVQASAWKSVRDAVQRAVTDGAAAVVVVGNDQSFAHVLEDMMGTRVPLGYLPMAEPMGLATALGIPKGLEAVKILAARHLERVGYLYVNQKHIGLAEVRCRGAGGKVVTEEGWSLGLSTPGDIVCRNPLRELSVGVGMEVLLVPDVESVSRWPWQKPVERVMPPPAMQKKQVSILGPTSGEWMVTVDGREIPMRSGTVVHMPDALTFIAARPRAARVPTVEA